MASVITTDALKATLKEFRTRGDQWWLKGSDAEDMLCVYDGSGNKLTITEALNAIATAANVDLTFSPEQQGNT